MFRSYNINNSATLTPHFIANHFNGTWNESSLEKLFQLWKNAWVRACAYWRAFFKQLELDHKLTNYRVKVLLYTFIELVQSLVQHENFMQLAAIISFHINFQILFEFLRKSSEGHTDEFAALL